MGWPGPRRRAVPLRLSEDEERPVQELAAQIPPRRNGQPNLSAALRRIIAEWADGRGRSDLSPQHTPSGSETPDA